MQFKIICKLIKKEKLVFGCQLYLVLVYIQGILIDWFVFQCNIVWQIFFIFYFLLFIQCGGYLDDFVGIRLRLGSADCQLWGGGYFLVTGYCDRWLQWRFIVYVYAYKRWEYIIECFQFYFKLLFIVVLIIILR